MSCFITLAKINQDVVLIFIIIDLMITIAQMVKYIKSRSVQLSIVKLCHIDPTSGHLVVKKTVSRVKEKFIRKGLWNRVKDIVTKGPVSRFYHTE